MQDAEESADRQGLAQLDPWLKLFPRPAVHSDLSAFAAFALAHENRAAHRIEVSLGERERFADPETRTPENDDECAESDRVRIVASGASGSRA